MDKNKYADMTIEQLARQFSSENYANLSLTDKQALLQSVVDEKCRKDGLDPIKVDLEPMEGFKGGHYDGHRIVMNSNMVGYGCYMQNGKVYPINDTGFRSLEVAAHEYRHAWQDAVVQGKVQGTKEEVYAFTANRFVSTPLENGQVGCQYVKPGKEGQELYFLNPRELDAFKTSQEEVKAMLENVPDNDPGKQAYLKNLSHRGWETRLESCRQKYGEISKDPAKDMETVLSNAYYGTKEPVSKDFKTLVETEMVNTHNSLYHNAALENTGDLARLDAAQPTAQVQHTPADTQVIDLDAFDQAQSQGAVHEGSHAADPTPGGSGMENDNDNDNDNDNGISM